MEFAFVLLFISVLFASSIIGTAMALMKTPLAGKP